MINVFVVRDSVTHHKHIYHFRVDTKSSYIGYNGR